MERFCQVPPKLDETVSTNRRENGAHSAAVQIMLMQMCHYFNPRPHMLLPHPRMHMGGGECNPHSISPLIEIELKDKGQTNPWDVLNPMVPELTSLGHILTPSGRVKVKS